MHIALFFEDLNPKTNKTASIILDFPLPFGPITQLKCLSKGPKVCLPLYDLKFSISSFLKIVSNFKFEKGKIFTWKKIPFLLNEILRTPQKGSLLTPAPSSGKFKK